MSQGISKEFTPSQPKGLFGRKSSSKGIISVDRTFSSSSTDFRQSCDGAFDEEEEFEEDTVKVNPSHHVHRDCNCPAGGSSSSSSNSQPELHAVGLGGGHGRSRTSGGVRFESYPFIEEEEDDGSYDSDNFRGKGKEDVFEFEDAEISIGLPSDLPSGMVDIEGNIIGNVDNVRFGQDDDDLSSSDDQHYGHNSKIKDKLSTQSITGNEYSSSNCGGAGIGGGGGGGRSRDLLPSSHADDNILVSDLPCLEDGPSDSQSMIVGETGRKKSILSNRSRFTRSGGGVSVNSFNGSAGGSSIISDGKMGSMNGSFNSQFYNNFYSRAARRNDFQRYTRGPYAPLDRCNSTSASSATSSTITQHYYPEGGWGFVVLATAMFSHALLCGFLLSAGVFSIKTLDKFGHELRMETVWMTSLSLGLSLFLSPLWVSICKRKSTRLTAVIGGLMSSLGCLFTSFASQFHQLYFSYAIFLSVGVGLTRDASFLMVGQYFKRKRELVEMFLVSSSGFGILVMSSFMEFAISSIGWRLGLQAMTGSLVLTFFLGSCYRSASLYHPQRRAIIHLKNQKRKIKEKEKRNDKPPFLDFSVLSNHSFQILLVSTACTAWGIYAPLFHLALECFDEAVGETDILLVYVYIGLGWVIGCGIFGFLAMQRTEECRISKMYLCQASSLILGISMLALANVKEVGGVVSFSWAYGLGLGAYNYNLKVYVYDKIRARMFPRAWSFVQSVHGLALFFGIPIIGYINSNMGWRTGYYACAGSIFLGFLIQLLSTVGRGRLRRNKSRTSSMKTCETTDSMQSPGLRRISFTFPDEQMSPRISKDSRSICSERSGGNPSSSNEQPMMPKELTRISEEGILDAN